MNLPGPVLSAKMKKLNLLEGVGDKKRMVNVWTAKVSVKKENKKNIRGGTKKKNPKEGAEGTPPAQKKGTVMEWSRQEQSGYKKGW